MNRKQFIITSALSAFSLSTFGRIISNPNQNVFTGDCDTTSDILGPFYRTNSPTRTDLTFDNLKGSKVELKGIIYKDDCKTPVKNANIEIWHCDTEGKYDNETNQFRHRGQQKTNNKGEYTFKTILPGKYLNGKLYRPAHIHIRVTDEKHQELISQIYFKGDPHITLDPWASIPKAEHRVLPLILEDTYGGLIVNFNIYLKSK